MHDQADIAADPHRQEVRVFRLVEFVQLHAGLRRVHLQVERGDFHRFLLLAGEPRQALRERVGDAEFHDCIPMLNVACRISRCSLPAIDQGSTIDITPMTNVKIVICALHVINFIDDTIGSSRGCAIPPDLSTPDTRQGEAHALTHG